MILKKMTGYNIISSCISTHIQSTDRKSKIDALTDVEPDSVVTIQINMTGNIMHTVLTIYTKYS